MSREYGLDPVSAISEAEATGDLAAIFADIRQTMQLPMLTSIWRTLAAIPNGLPTSWAAAKPLFQTGQPDAVLKEFREQAQLPVPKSLSPGQLAGEAVPPEDLPAIRSVIAAYNRSNALNLIALTALISEPAGNWPAHPVPPGPPPWGTMPTLLTERDMEPETWRLIERENQLGRNIGGIGTSDVVAPLGPLARSVGHRRGTLQTAAARRDHRKFGPQHFSVRTRLRRSAGSTAKGTSFDSSPGSANDRVLRARPRESSTNGRDRPRARPLDRGPRQVDGKQHLHFARHESYETNTGSSVNF